MTVERHVVVVENVSGDAIDQRRGFGRAPGAGGNERNERGAAARPKLAIDQSDLRVARAGNQDAETVGNAGAGNGGAFRRDLAQAEIGDEAAELERESAHVFLRCGRSADPRYSAALSRTGAPARNCSNSAASSALAAARCRCLTWPKPRIFSGMAASPTAR